MMADFDANDRANFRLRTLGWALPIVLAAMALGLETEWGRALHKSPPQARAESAKPVALALLPEYAIDGGLERRTETSARTMFNPTRRPAPPVQRSEPATQMQRGRFVLTGTSLAGDASVAFLKEIAGGRSWFVKRGDQINGVLVAEVKPDRVKLALGAETEEVYFKAGSNVHTPMILAPAPQAAAPQAQYPGNGFNPPRPPTFVPAPLSPAQQVSPAPPAAAEPRLPIPEGEEGST